MRIYMCHTSALYSSYKIRMDVLIYVCRLRNQEAFERQVKLDSCQARLEEREKVIFDLRE